MISRLLFKFTAFALCLIRVLWSTTICGCDCNIQTFSGQRRFCFSDRVTFMCSLCDPLVSELFEISAERQHCLSSTTRRLLLRRRFAVRRFTTSNPWSCYSVNRKMGRLFECPVSNSDTRVAARDFPQSFAFPAGHTQLIKVCSSCLDYLTLYPTVTPQHFGGHEQFGVVGT